MITSHCIKCDETRRDSPSKPHCKGHGKEAVGPSRRIKVGCFDTTKREGSFSWQKEITRSTAVGVRTITLMKTYLVGEGKKWVITKFKLKTPHWLRQCRGKRRNRVVPA